MAKIVLAHGIFGFGTAQPFSKGVYFNGIAGLYEKEGHQVLAPTVAALGSLKDRSADLAEQIRAWGHDEPLYMLAHSMGGLDCRRVIAQHPDIGDRVKRLITISTPHYGSPVADALLDQEHLLRPHIPALLLALLGKNAGALEDLKTRKAKREALQDPDKDGVDYIAIGCNAKGSWLPSPLFKLAEMIGRLTHEKNDGVVTLVSAAGPHARSEVWTGDHGDAIGWPTDWFGIKLAAAALVRPADHVARYMALLPRLVA